MREERNGPAGIKAAGLLRLNGMARFPEVLHLEDCTILGTGRDRIKFSTLRISADRSVYKVQERGEADLA